MAFWDFQPGAALTEACDADVTNVCPSIPMKKNAFTIGAVGRCLTRQLAEGKPLSPGCRKLVSVAAPKDIRVYLQVLPLPASVTKQPAGARSVYQSAEHCA